MRNLSAMRRKEHHEKEKILAFMALFMIVSALLPRGPLAPAWAEEDQKQASADQQRIAEEAGPNEKETLTAIELDENEHPAEDGIREEGKQSLDSVSETPSEETAKASIASETAGQPETDLLENHAAEESQKMPLANTESEEDQAALESSPLKVPTPLSGGAPVIKIGDTEYPSLKDALTAAQEGDVLTAVADEIVLTDPVSIPAAKKLTLDLNGKTMVVANDKSTSSILSVSNSNLGVQGAFTLKNGKVTSRDGDGDGYTSGFLYVSNSDIYMNNVEVSNVKSNISGSALCLVSDKIINANIQNCNFHDNRASESGGALKISIGKKEAESSEINIINNKFTNNRAEALGEVFRASFGGAISLGGPGKYLIKGNDIIGNEAFVKTEYYYYNIYYSCGGGIVLGGTLNIGGCEDVTLEGNTISKNKAQFLGGGVSCQMEKRNDKLTIKSGIFAYNKSEFSGGGLDLSLHNQPLAVLKNVIITQNKAAAGAGVWACPTSRVRTHSTLGATIIGNTLDQGVEKAVYDITGTDVRFEGQDTKYKNILQENDPSYHTMTVQDRTFLGNKVDWYADEPGALYKEGDPVLTPDKYTDRSTSFGLYGKILAGDDWYQKHAESAKIIFIGNVAKERGGAIATNTDIDFGEENLDVDVKVTKQWKDEQGKEWEKDLPKSVQVKLIRQDASGGRYDLETVELNAENKWSYLFSKLPSKGIVDGEEKAFSYTVEEVDTPKGWKASVTPVTPLDGSQYEFILENQKKPEEPPEEPPTPEEPPAPKEPPVPTGASQSEYLYLGIFSSALLLACCSAKRKKKAEH